MSTPRSAVEAPPPPPDAKDVPWWGALILAILTSLVSVIATIYYLRGSALQAVFLGMRLLVSLILNLEITTLMTLRLLFLAVTVVDFILMATIQ